MTAAGTEFSFRRLFLGFYQGLCGYCKRAIGGVSLVLPGLFGGQLSGRVVTTLPSICLEKTRQTVAIHPPPDKSGTVTGGFFILSRTDVGVNSGTVTVRLFPDKYRYSYRCVYRLIIPA